MGSPDENCGGSHPIFSSLRTCPAARNPLALEGPMRPSLDMMPPITWPWWRWRSRPWTHSPLGSSTVLQRLDVLQMGTTMPNLEWEYEWELWIITLRTISFGWLLIKGLFVLRRTWFFLAIQWFIIVDLFLAVAIYYLLVFSPSDVNSMAWCNMVFTWRSCRWRYWTTLTHHGNHAKHGEDLLVCRLICWFGGAIFRETNLFGFVGGP